MSEVWKGVIQFAAGCLIVVIGGAVFSHFREQKCVELRGEYNHQGVCSIEGVSSFRVELTISEYSLALLIVLVFASILILAINLFISRHEKV